MKVLGTVLHISSHKNLIIQGDELNKEKKRGQLPNINTAVFDRKMNRIGKVNDIFGPVGDPYFSVRVSSVFSGEGIRELKNRHVYVK